MSRAILVFAQVSQRRRDVPGSGRAGLHATPRGLRRYRSGLARRHAMTFFEREPGMPWPLPKTTDADLEAVLRHEPGLQPGKRCIRFAHDAGAKSFVICGKFRLGTARPGARTCLDRPLPPSQNFVDIGHTDPEDGGCSISACSGIPRRHDTLAQVLRVLSPSLPLRRINGERESKISPCRNPWADSINSEDALAVLGRRSRGSYPSANEVLPGSGPRRRRKPGKAFVWCGRPESNRHSVTRTGF